MKRIGKWFLVLAMFLSATFTFGDISKAIMVVEVEDNQPVAIYSMQGGLESDGRNFMVFTVVPLVNRSYYFPTVIAEQGSMSWKWEAMFGEIHILNPKWYDFGDDLETGREYMFGVYLDYYFDKYESVIFHIKTGNDRLWHEFSSLIDDEYDDQILYRNDTIFLDMRPKE